MEKVSKSSEMSAIAEASQLLRIVAEPRPVGDSVKSAITRAARRVGFPIARAENIWRQEARRIDASEMDRLRAVAMQKQEATARDQYTELRERIATLEITLAKALALDAQPYSRRDDLDRNKNY